ncbi:MAG TPA: hypothetical protein VHV83_12250, partial [Armatimonadota bacterium]|nr:hypothetical protein [Armatimonadota bacterium]
TGQPNEALHELDIAEKLLPDDADVLRQRALVHGSIGEIEEAVAVLQESLRLDGESTESYFWLGYFRIHLAQYQGALETAEQLLALIPMSAEGHIVRCAALRALHRHREADDELAWLTQQESDLLERLREDPVMEKLLNPHKEQEDGVVSRFRRSLVQRWQEIRRVKESH